MGHAPQQHYHISARSLPHIATRVWHPKYSNYTYFTSQAKDFTKLLSVSWLLHIQPFVLFYLDSFTSLSLLYVVTKYKPKSLFLCDLGGRGGTSSSSENTSNFNSHHHPKNNTTWFWGSCLGLHSYLFHHFSLDFFLHILKNQSFLSTFNYLMAVKRKESKDFDYMLLLQGVLLQKSREKSCIDFISYSSFSQIVRSSHAHTSTPHTVSAYGTSE